MTKIIRAYYEQHKSVFEFNFLMVLDDFNIEAIHKMRTSTKRLRALFILIEFLSGKNFKAKKQLKKIRALFRFSGRIREIQIEQQLILEYQTQLDQDYSTYLEYLKQREHREIARFLKYLPSHTERESMLKDEKIKMAIDQLKMITIKKPAIDFVKIKENKIRELTSKSHSNHRIHSNRTHLKQLYYLFEILTHLIKAEKLLDMTNERIREIEQYFGEWHDLVNSPVYMNAFFKTKKFRGDKKYVALKKVIAGKRIKMRNEIIDCIYPELIS